MAHFALLRDPARYVADNWDMAGRVESRGHWIDLFEAHFAQTLAMAAGELGRASAPRIERAREEFAAWMARLRQDATTLGNARLTGMDLDRLRERIMRENDLGDPYRSIKDRENDSAVALYGEHVRRLDGLVGRGRGRGREKWLAIIRGIFAGNRFDLGAQSIRHASQQAPDFLESLSWLKPRPWLVDEFDRLADDLETPGRWAKAVLFIDNAGADFVLGVVPFARALASGGTQVVLAANEAPALNDITLEETRVVLTRLSEIDGRLQEQIAAGRIRTVSSGSRIPMIDLAEVPEELNQAARGADLVVLEGMGRAVESNYDARFTVDTLHLALLKDEEVARRIGGWLYDCVCKYTGRPS